MARKIDYSVWQMNGVGNIGTTHYKVPEEEGLRGVFLEIAYSISKKDDATRAKIQEMKNNELLNYITVFNNAMRGKAIRYIKWKDDCGTKREINLTLKTVAKILEKNYNFK